MKQTENELIKAAIDRLHARNSGDFESLLRQVEHRRRKIELNVPQLIAAVSKQMTKILEWARGTGKTTFRGFDWTEKLREMPRSTGLFIGPTYQMILTRIVPSLVQGLEMFGLYENLHYFIGKQPPRSWRNAWGAAYQPPAKFDKYITFWNGMGVHLISHDVPGDGRGLNSDWIDGDEAAMLDPRKLQENTDPTLRGTNKQAFEKSRHFGSKTYSSTTPLEPEGQWFIDYEDRAMADPKNIAFISATSAYNRHNLRDGYLEEAKENAYAPWVYDAEYENKRPKFVKEGFYTLLDVDVHCYTNYDYDFYQVPGAAVDCRGDKDLVKGVPLILGIDWGATINCLTVNQHLQSINEYRTLKSMYVLGEDQKIQDDLFKDFDAYYKHHDCREIYLWYDNSGNNRTGNTRQTKAEQAREQLVQLGWRVYPMAIGGSNPEHDAKWMVWTEVLKEGREHDYRFPVYRMNKGNCRELYLSMKNAKAKPGTNGRIQKDKSSEKSKKIPRQEATDLSDANDAPLYGMFAYLLNDYGSVLPGMSVSRK